jgi:glutamate-5-semialdehyde dehydrogenase
MQLRGIIDCLVPRGGPSLIASVLEHATVPYIIDGDGNCHVYVDAAADLDAALAIVVNAKTQRPSVCNAAESLLVHRDVAGSFLPRAQAALEDVELVGDERTTQIVPGVQTATKDDFATEFLDLKLSVAVVDSLDAAIDHIRRYGSGHSEAIVTDGSELGLGAEIGISTQKLHTRGPMGLHELTTVKYVIHGEGQVRT